MSVSYDRCTEQQLGARHATGGRQAERPVPAGEVRRRDPGERRAPGWGGHVARPPGVAPPVTMPEKGEKPGRQKAALIPCTSFFPSFPWLPGRAQASLAPSFFISHSVTQPAQFPTASRTAPGAQPSGSTAPGVCSCQAQRLACAAAERHGQNVAGVRLFQLGTTKAPTTKKKYPNPRGRGDALRVQHRLAGGSRSHCLWSLLLAHTSEPPRGSPWQQKAMPVVTVCPLAGPPGSRRHCLWSQCAPSRVPLASSSLAPAAAAAAGPPATALLSSLAVPTWRQQQQLGAPERREQHQGGQPPRHRQPVPPQPRLRAAAGVAQEV